MDADVIIAGGGAAGAFAGVLCGEWGKKTIIFEPNGRIGRKLAITGKGRCNVTNNCDNAQLMKNIPVNPKFLYSAFSKFSSEDTMNFFEQRGVPLKTERGNRVFPQSDKAVDIVNALDRGLKMADVKIIKKRVTKVITHEGVCTGVEAGGCVYTARSVLLATGGCSYPVTGSTGDGYELARAVGHSVTPLKPSLVPIECSEKYCGDMMGLSLKNVTLTLFDRDKKLYSELGEMLFTHFGVSGPLVLSASSHIREFEPDRYRLKIDLKPALDEKQLDNRLLRDFKENINRIYGNSLSKLLPSKMIPTVVRLSGIEGERKVNSITREERLGIVKVLKGLPLTVKGFRPVEEAIITSGGIDIKEIDPKTMESKLVQGLYFAGELIDVDAYTGGFNLQIAFSTAFAAAENMG